VVFVAFSLNYLIIVFFSMSIRSFITFLIFVQFHSKLIFSSYPCKKIMIK